MGSFYTKIRILDRFGDFFHLFINSLLYSEALKNEETTRQIFVLLPINYLNRAAGYPSLIKIVAYYLIYN